MIESIILKVWNGSSLTEAESTFIQAYGQAGDYIGGIWGTLVGALTLLVVAATWFSTHRINERTKKYQIFSEILRSHEEIIGSIRVGEVVGRDAFGIILREFYHVYGAVLLEHNRTGRHLTLAQRIDIAYVFTYYGAHPETVNILRKSYHTFSGYNVFKVLNEKKKSRKGDNLDKFLLGYTEENASEDEIWQASIRDGLELLKRTDPADGQWQALRNILLKAKRLPTKKINKRNVINLVEELAIESEFGGHQNRLSNYFRNLYSAFTFIQDSGLSRKEKYALAKVLRAKLSNYEQALLAINSLSNQGSAWIRSGIINNYSLIKNIPEGFFSFDKEFSLSAAFPEVQFEWIGEN